MQVRGMAHEVIPRPFRKGITYKRILMVKGVGGEGRGALGVRFDPSTFRSFDKLRDHREGVRACPQT